MIYTNSIGHSTDVSTLTVEDVDYPSIILGLSREGRFANQTTRLISVAEHTVLGYYELVNNFQLGPAARMWWVSHDFSEAFLRDIPSHIKKGLPGYQTLEASIQRVFRADLGVFEQDLPMDFLHKFDHYRSYVEAQEVFPNARSENWDIDKVEVSYPVVPEKVARTSEFWRLQLDEIFQRTGRALRHWQETGVDLEYRNGVFVGKKNLGV